jgi:LacI family repressor for deo operon, udp, cdd, tsx, nupC, and nupG
VVGFDDPAWASFYVPAITTLREERFYMGRLACDTLIAAIQGPGAAFRQTPEITFRTELVVRESCGGPRQGDTIGTVARRTRRPRRAAAGGR